MIKIMVDNLRDRKPLIHNITNYVTVNDCANILIAAGASPIMSDEPKDVVDITSICNGLNINIGTLQEKTIKSMVLAGTQANKLGNPVLLDPVGVGASALRDETCVTLLQNIKFTVIRGNVSEIKALATGIGGGVGVDASESDLVNPNNIDSVIAFAKSFAVKTKAVIIISGPVDIITDGTDTYTVSSGVEMMSKITGSGCMLSAMTTAFIAANRENILMAAVASVSAMGVAGEIAYEKMIKNDAGNSTYRNYLIDEIFKLTGKSLEEKAKFKKV